MRKEFEFGLQGVGGTGAWNHWAPLNAQEQKHGSAIFGKITLYGNLALKHNAEELIGMNNSTPNHTFRMQTASEFQLAIS